MADETPRKIVWIYVVILGGGVVIFFLGGLLLRNPNLPSYLYSKVSSWLKNENAATGRPSPKTAEDYLDLTRYDLRRLPSDQRAIAMALADANGNAAGVQDRLTALAQRMRNDLPGLKSANAISTYAKIKGEAVTLLDAAGQQKRFFANLESNLTEQFVKAGLPEELAKQIAILFYQTTPGQKAIDEATKLEKLANELVAVANLLAETPDKWQVSSDGTIHSSDKKLDEEYQAHQAALGEVVMEGEK